MVLSPSFTLIHPHETFVLHHDRRAIDKVRLNHRYADPDNPYSDGGLELVSAYL